MATILTFLKSQLFVVPPEPTASADGKTVIVTGANTGLGLEAARYYVRLGAKRVILACRNMEKGAKAKANIEASEQKNGVVDVWELDLAKFASVKSFAKMAAQLDRLDIVIENAGINTQNFTLFEGHESIVTTNVISTFLLALLLIPTLKKTAKTHKTRPVLSIVSSEAHLFTWFPEGNADNIYEQLRDPAKARMKERYSVSKLLEVFACREICKQCPVDQENPSSPTSFPITINFLNPGLCHSEIFRDQVGAIADMLISALKYCLARKTEIGARTLVNAGLGGPQTHGQYLSDCVVAEVSSVVTSEKGQKLQTKLWEELGDILEGIEPGILRNLK